MVTLARKEKLSPDAIRRATTVDAMASAEVRTRLVTQGKQVFRSELERAELALPKDQADVYVAAFESAMTEVLSSLSKIDLCSDATSEREKASSHDAVASKPLQPTARLRRAMSSAKRVEQGRFATVEDVFRSLGQADQS